MVPIAKLLIISQCKSNKERLWLRMDSIHTVIFQVYLDLVPLCNNIVDGRVLSVNFLILMWGRCLSVQKMTHAVYMGKPKIQYPVLMYLRKISEIHCCVYWCKGQCYPLQCNYSSALWVSCWCNPSSHKIFFQYF